MGEDVIKSSYKNSDPLPDALTGSESEIFARMPRMDWDRPPWNRWSFQRIRNIMPTAVVRRGDANTNPLPRNEQDIEHVRFSRTKGISQTIAEFLDDSYTDGFLVMADGHVIHESYYNGMEPHTPHLMQSVSKSITATVTGMMISRGQLDPHALVRTYIPALADTAWAGATLQHVLDMTTGVQYSEEYTKLDSDVGKTDVASGWRPIAPDASPDIDWPASVWDQILSLKSCDAEHGERFLYRSIETDLLAHVMMQVSGLPLHELISKELWQSMGAEEDGYFTVDARGYGLASGGFNGCLRDFGRFGQLYLNDGMCHGKQIVPTEWITDVRRGPHGLFSEDRRKILPNGCYRNQFWIEDQNLESFMCLGVFGQLIYIAPAYNMVVVKLSTWPDFLNDEFKADTQLAIHAIAAALGKPVDGMNKP
ncbi:MAG: serine hydrolase domain-containing protein [Candidatus Puniceispirillales bacterium]